MRRAWKTGLIFCYGITEKVKNLEFYYRVTEKGLKGATMNAEGHKKKADELWHSIEKLKTEPDENVVAIVELAFGMCHHLVAYGTEKKHSRHIDAHAGVARLLRELDEKEIADAFDMLGSLRQGRFYGGKSDGPTVRKTLELIETIRRWVER